jgi:putative intracellular protease/amidase
MKFIKKFESHKKEVIPKETLFTDDEFFEIKDIYTDLADDVNLTDVNREGQMTIPMTSNLSYFSKMSGEKFKIDIRIRTAKLEFSASFLVSRKEDMEKYNSITKDIQPFIDTLKSMGYEVNKSDIDYKLDSWEYVTAGIKISITK